MTKVYSDRFQYRKMAPLVPRAVAIAMGIFLLTTASRWPLAEYHSISIIWPASGLMWYALLTRRFVDVVGILIGLAAWGYVYLGVLGLFLALISLLSPFCAWLISHYWLANAGWLGRFKRPIAYAFGAFIAAVAFVVTLRIGEPWPGIDLLNLWFVYFFIDLSSYLVVLPAVLVLLNRRVKHLEWRAIAVVLLVLASPYFIALVGFNDQVIRGSHLAVIPLLTWLAVSARSSTLAVSILVIFTLQMLYSARGWMGYQPATELFEFMQWYVVLLSVVVTTLLLSYNSRQNKQLLARFQEQAMRDDQTATLNNRGFARALSQSSGLLYVVRNLDSAQLKAALSWQEFQALEQSVANRLRYHYRDSAIARLGAGEFAVLLPVGTAPAAFQAALKQPFQFNRRTMPLRFNYGFLRHEPSMLGSVARCLNGLNLISQRTDERIIDCDARKDDIVFYEGLTHLHQFWLQKIAQGALALHVQPIVRLSDPAYRAYEVLLRLEVDGVVVSPKEVLDTFGVMNDMQTLDLLVTERLIALLKEDEQRLQGLGHLSFNLTGTSVQSNLFIDEFLAMWQTSDFPLSKLVIEITENEKIIDLDRAVENAQRLRDAGFNIAIDDFGEGEASFAYLKRFPCDTVKIDGQFVRTIESNEPDKAIVSAIVQVARVMNLHTVAEFVEKDSMITQLTEMGVDYGQGYALGRPEPWSRVFGTKGSD